MYTDMDGAQQHSPTTSARLSSARHRLVRGGTILLRRGINLTTNNEKRGPSHDDDDKDEEDDLYVVDGAVTDIVRCMYIMPLLLGRSWSRNLSSGAWILASRLLNQRELVAPPECSPSSTGPVNGAEHVSTGSL